MSAFGCVCDRCSRPYETNNWPGPSLCGYCDLNRQARVWRYPGALVKSAAEIRAAS